MDRLEAVDAIIDVPNSAVVLAVQQPAREHNRVLLVSTAGTADFTSPVGVHWTWDTFAFAASSAKSIVQRGGDSWCFLTTDFAFFLLQAQCSRAKVVALANGGTDITNSIKQAAEFAFPKAGSV